MDPGTVRAEEGKSAKNSCSVANVSQLRVSVKFNTLGRGIGCLASLTRGI